MSNNNCIVCNSEKTEIFLHHESFNILKCLGCGLYYQDTQNKFATLKMIYDNIYEESPKSFANSKYYEKRSKVQYDDVMEFSKKKGSMLEVGCSYGSLMEFFIKNGWQAKGIDISENAIRYTKSKRLDCFNVTPEEFKPKEKFDVIILSNVLEHLENPLNSLNIIKNWLSETGFIYIRVPNVESKILPSQRQSFLGDLKPFEHFFYFNQKNLKLLFKKAGLHGYMKTDGFINIGNALNCYFRSKIVMRSSWHDFNFKTKTSQKKIYLFLKHVYGEILTFLTYVPIGPKNREIVAWASLQELKNLN